MIDLHSHTTESDGTLTPEELVQSALAERLEALAITDHDTFSGYRAAVPHAEETGLRLLCGIELSTKADTGRKQTVHLLGYFFRQAPAEDFCDWLANLQVSRRDRNRRLAARLQSMGFDIRLEEVEVMGRNMAGRPHFARLMVSKGYVPNYRAAFDRYLDEAAPGYVDREEPSLAEGIRRIRDAGGISSVAHPIRLSLSEAVEEKLVADCAEQGLDALEAFHSDHGPAETQRYLSLAERYGLGVTGGSDFHGDNKPGVRLGQGPGHLSIPVTVLDAWLA